MFELNATFLIFLVMFIGFMMAFNAQVLKPIGAAMEKRQQRIKQDTEAGATARAAATEVVADYEKKLHAARTQAQATLNEVLSQAQQVRQMRMNEVQKEGHAQLLEAKKAIAAERVALVDQLVVEERTLVATIVKKLLGDQAAAQTNIDPAAAKRALEEVS